MDIRLEGGEAFFTCAAYMRGTAGKTLRTNFTRSIKNTVAPLIPELRAAVRDIPTTGSPGGGSAQRQAHRQGRSRSKRTVAARGLRDTAASAIRLRARYGARPDIRIYVATSAMPPSQAKLPQYLNRYEGWRHPRWGDRGYWYPQRGKPWFDVTINRHRQRMRTDVQESLGATLAEIARRVTSGK